MVLGLVPAYSSLEHLRGVGVGNPSPDVDVLRHARSGVPKVVCDLASRQTRVIESCGNRLTERVAGYPAETGVAECPTKVSGRVGGVPDMPYRAREDCHAGAQLGILYPTPEDRYDIRGGPR